jgi:Fe2+ transport system protein B
LESNEMFRNTYQHYLWKHYGYKIDSSRIKEYFGKEHSIRLQIEETLQRCSVVEDWISNVDAEKKKRSDALTNRLDAILTQPVVGVTIFTLIMFCFFGLHGWKNWVTWRELCICSIIC